MESSLPGSQNCFAIMPFGEKTAADGTIIDFNDVYEHLIKKTVEALGIRCIRCDEIAESGWIHSKMFEHVYLTTSPSWTSRRSIRTSSMSLEFDTPLSTALQY